MVGGDRVRDILQNRLTRARRRDDETTLALAERRDEIDDARGEILVGQDLEFHLEALVRIERGQVVEVNLVTDFSGSSKLIVLTFSSASRARASFSRGWAFDRIARLQREAADLRGDVDIVGTGR